MTMPFFTLETFSNVDNNHSHWTNGLRDRDPVVLRSRKKKMKKSQKDSSSSSIFGAGGNTAYRISAFEAVFTLTPVLVPRLSPEALHTRRRERPLLTQRGIKGEKWPVKFS
jgi:hypothetical protein